MHVNGEFQRITPAIFNRPGLEGLVYAETRRQNATADILSGNVGPSPVILGEENYLRTQTQLEYADWRQLQLARVAARLQNAKTAFGFDDIGYMRVKHGNDLINLDKNITSVSIDTPFSSRAVADASILTETGLASLYAPADCGVVTIAFPETEAIIQTHVGIRGAANAVIPRTLARAAAMGLDTTRAVAYGAPLAHSYQMDRTEANDVYEIIAEQDSETKTEFLRNVTIGSHGHPILHITGMMQQQLERSGLGRDNIEITPVDTIDNPLLFSHQDAVTKGVVNGRFGVLAGKVIPR